MTANTSVYKDTSVISLKAIDDAISGHPLVLTVQTVSASVLKEKGATESLCFYRCVVIAQGLVTRIEWSR